MTDQSLREELDKLFSQYIPDECPSKELVTDEVISIFEKRIDTKLKSPRKLDISEKEIIFTQGYNSAIYDITEILK